MPVFYSLIEVIIIDAELYSSNLCLPLSLLLEYTGSVDSVLFIGAEMPLSSTSKKSSHSHHVCDILKLSWGL